MKDQKGSKLSRLRQRFQRVASPEQHSWRGSCKSHAVVLALFAAPVYGENRDEGLDELAKQNESMLVLAKEQQSEIAELRARLEVVEQADREQADEIRGLEQDVVASMTDQSSGQSDPSRVRLSGAAAFAFFAGEADTQFPNEEFLVDNVRVNVEAEIARRIFLTAQFEPYRREPSDRGEVVSEFFVDLENSFALNNYELLAFRIGRFQIPFGEEYLHRYSMENPLVSHSVADIWGIDEGVEVFGNADRFSYTVAIQNGSLPTLRDFDADKSLTVRLGYDLGESLSFSGSWMDTGDFDVASREFSEIWIGNNIFIPIGSAQTTKFSVGMAQLDAAYRWTTGEAKLAYGEARYRDNDPLEDNQRDLEFFQIETRQDITDELYAAFRYSFIHAEGGYPLAGHGPRAKYFTGGILTEKLERLSLGLGYWLRDDALLKLEYSFEDGERPDGLARLDSDLLSAEFGVRF